MNWITHLIKALVALVIFVSAAPAYAATCSSAAAQGSAPAAWETYCWLDFTDYVDATARSAGGQNLSYTLSDGATLSFNIRATSTGATAANAIPAPSWTGAAVGNSAFLMIPGRPVLYMANNGTTVNFTLSSILITPPAGSSAVTTYAFVAADAESTDGAESIQFGTNGSNWTILDEVPPISGSQYPTNTGVGTATFLTSGGGNTGNVGGYIVGSNSPTTVTARMIGSGLQGMMFAVRFASIKLAKQIVGARVNAADQFTFRINSTTSGATLSTGTTSGTGNGPFAAATLSLASGIAVTINEVMAAGSVSTLAQYSSRLNCINGTAGSSTVMPSNVATTSYNLSAMQFGDAIRCTFTNAAFPHLRVQKALGAGGRRFSTDQFTVQINQGATTVASATTTGTGTTVTGGATALTQVTSGTNYALTEVAAGGSLAQYNAAMVCTNAAAGSSTTLPNIVGGTITPVLGDIVTCTITNTRKAANAELTMTKVSTVVSDPVNGITNPKAIPGAIIRYTITVTNTGSLAVDSSSIVITDPLPTTVTYNAASPVVFTNGAPVSGLNAFNASTMVTFSSQAGGGAPYTYAPNTTGFDASVRGVRIAPTGIMSAATAAGQPSFSVSFLTRIN